MRKKQKPVKNIQAEESDKMRFFNNLPDELMEHVLQFSNEKNDPLRFVDVRFKRVYDASRTTLLLNSHGKTVSGWCCFLHLYGINIVCIECLETLDSRTAH